MDSNGNVDLTCHSNKIIDLNVKCYVDRLDDSILKKEEIKVLKEISKKLDYISCSLKSSDYSNYSLRNKL